MIWGLSTATFTLVHVVLSVVLFGALAVLAAVRFRAETAPALSPAGARRSA